MRKIIFLIFSFIYVFAYTYPLKDLPKTFYAWKFNGYKGAYAKVTLRVFTFKKFYKEGDAQFGSWSCGHFAVGDLCSDGGLYMYFSTYKSKQYNLDPDCELSIDHQTFPKVHMLYRDPEYGYYVSDSSLSTYINYCLPRDGYKYDPNHNYWVNKSTGQKICNPNSFNDGNNSCENVCKAGNMVVADKDQLYCMAPTIDNVAKLYGDDARNCHFGRYQDGSLKVITANGMAFIGLICPTGAVLIPYADSDLTNNNDTLKYKPKKITCSDNEDVVINDDGSVTCEPKSDDSNSTGGNDSNSSNGGGNNTGGNDSNSTNGDGNNTGGGSTGGNDSNSTNTKDCCYYYTNPAQGDSWEQNGDKWCSQKYHCCIEKDQDGKCKVYDSGKTDTNGTSLAGIEGELENINSGIKSLHDAVGEIKDLKPTISGDGDSDLGVRASPKFDRLFDVIGNFKTFTSNIKTSLSDIKNNLSNLNNYLQNNKNVTISSLDNKQYICPIAVNIYGKAFRSDPCAFVSPLRPLIELFFTLIFSINVIFFFIKHIVLRSSE